MKEYRIQMNATVCVSIRAASKPKAIAGAKKLRDDLCEGVDLELASEYLPGAASYDGRVYLNEPADENAEEPEIVDIRDAD